MLLAGLVVQIGLVPAVQAREGAATAPLPVAGSVEIRRTGDGIPHLRARGWRELGLGIGYVQAQDALCTLAEAFVTYQGRRAWFFGPAGRPARDSTLGRPANLELDFFFKAQADQAMLLRLRAEQPPELNALVEGYAAGYNRYLADARRPRGAAAPAAPRACLHEAWVRDIAADDVYRRMVAAQVAAGLGRFIPQIAGARPGTQAVGAKSVPDMGALRTRLALRVGEAAGLGSNALALGRQATGEGAAVLFGNPHWYWGGPDRFYQMHLTIPGRLDVAGAGFLGVPLVMIGFNDHVAWSHTVSTARRFGLFDLVLDGADPTRYLVDGRSEPMTAHEVAVDLHADDGTPQRVHRTLYRTRFGPVLDLGSYHPAFGWGRAHALAIRDVNADNFRVFRNFFYWNQARSLDEFIAIQRREAAVPWVNTVAIGRGDGRVWYGDVGAVPHVPDALRETCATELSRLFAGVDVLTPFLDGSRSECNWRDDPAAVQPGAMPAHALPSLLRDDHVVNMNDSYWLANAHQPLEGFPGVLGGERQPLSLRGRLGHRIAGELEREPARSAQALGHRLMRAVLAPRAYSAELFKDELLDQACMQPLVNLVADGPPGEAGAGVPAGDTRTVAPAGHTRTGAPARWVDLAPACGVLRRWSGLADAGDRGALLWEAFWARLQALPPAQFYSVPFASDAPLATPRAPAPGQDAAARALAAAVVSMGERGLALDAPLGSVRFVASGSRRLPLFGGCHAAGYFTVVCSNEGDVARAGPDVVGNSYLQVVYFGPRGAVAHTLLAHGQHESALAGAEGRAGVPVAPVARYVRKDWLKFPFRDDEIARDPGLQRTVVRE
jgi:acyl-homoserine-lactone acylase